MSPYTIADVVNMVVCAGGIPRFVDLAPGTCNIDADKIEQEMTARTGVVLATGREFDIPYHFALAMRYARCEARNSALRRTDDLGSSHRKRSCS